ncbi:MAG: protein translocase subunit SecD [Gammaproteobacteria bacterium]|nr:protein translocase subunit SecD [Gammaproteobacteria bacterium]
MNQYPLWKYLLVIAVVLIGGLYALPNIYGNDPAVQVSAKAGSAVDVSTEETVKSALLAAGIEYKELGIDGEQMIVRFKNTEDQLKANTIIREDLGRTYSVAQNIVPATPSWLRQFNPMYLGLDLRGGVHLLLEVDMEAAVTKAEDRYVEDIRSQLRDKRVRYLSVKRRDNSGVEVRFRSKAESDEGLKVIKREFPALAVTENEVEGKIFLSASMTDQQIREVKSFAIEQNLTTLRNRVNELGVAEPNISRQGEDRIVVQLPGIQDSTRMRELLSATATLEFRVVDTNRDANEAKQSGRIPVGDILLERRDGSPVLLKRRVILTGDYIVDATSGFDSNSNSPAVFISLDSKGARRMSEATKELVGQVMGVVFIENKVETKIVDGEKVKTRETIREVINTATIQERLSKRFQITGLDNSREARDLALLLRAGALAVPIEIVEERTVGPTMGQDNIDQGFRSVLAGFCLVLVFMVIYYRLFGLIANLALFMNLVLIVAVLSMLQATLTLPGIAGIVLTVGMAVDANVLIFERIREELSIGNTPQASIQAGYEKAFVTIADANVTTLIASLVLFVFGTGPIKGFAITLSIGILTSMFTAIVGTRAVVNLMYGGKKLQKLSI